MRKTILIFAVLMAPALQAWECKYEKSIDQELDLAGSETLKVLASAGELDIKATSGDTARITGKVCVSDEDWLEDSGVSAKGGRNAEIAVQLPNANSGWGRNSYASLDLELEVPEGLALDVKDSSGELSIEGVSSVVVHDSSGDIEIVDVQGNVSLNDSSGDIDLERIGGNVTVVSDSSGDIRGDSVEGTVLVMKDSSGNIRFTDVGQDFIVERDSSGNITAKGVGGDFRVLRDGSGDIHASNVSGEVETPDKS